MKKFHHCSQLSLLYAGLALNASKNYRCSSTNWSCIFSTTQNNFSATIRSTCSPWCSQCTLCYCLAHVHREPAGSPSTHVSTLGTCNIHAHKSRWGQQRDSFCGVGVFFPFQSLVPYQKVSQILFTLLLTHQFSSVEVIYMLSLFFLARWQRYLHLWIDIVKRWETSKSVSLNSLQDGNLAYQKWLWEEEFLLKKILWFYLSRLPVCIQIW